MVVPFPLLPTLSVLILAAGAPRKLQEPASPLEQALREQFAVLPAEWRSARLERWTRMAQDPRVDPTVRSAVLAEAPHVLGYAASTLRRVQREAAESPERPLTGAQIEEGAKLCADLFENILRNGLRNSVLVDSEKASRAEQLAALEKTALSLIDRQIVGDGYARELVASEISTLFRQYREAIGNPLRPLMNQPLSETFLQEVSTRMAEGIPRDRTYLIEGLTRDPLVDRHRLQELGIEKLIYDVVVLRMYLSISNASWVDREAARKVEELERSLTSWEDRMEVVLGSEHRARPYKPGPEDRGRKDSPSAPSGPIPGSKESGPSKPPPLFNPNAPRIRLRRIIRRGSSLSLRRRQSPPFFSSRQGRGVEHDFTIDRALGRSKQASPARP